MQQQRQPVADYPSRSSSNAALDPTGMFRNRGRRVIAPSSSGGVPVQKKNECTHTPIPLSSPYYDATLSMTSPNDRVGHIVDDQQAHRMHAKSEEQSLIQQSGLQNIVQPEIDHPPQQQQSISLINLSDSVNYSIQSSQHNDEHYTIIVTIMTSIVVTS